MSKYVCSICGYVYDEQNEKVKFNDLPESWACPLCKAPKAMFNLVEEVQEKPVAQPKVAVEKTHIERKLSCAEMNVLFTNFVKGSEKQYRAEEAKLFGEIAKFYADRSEIASENEFEAISERLKNDLSKNFPESFESARADGDRGALRVLTWTEKVSKIEESLLARYKKEGAAFLEKTKIFVCEICGFIYVGEEAPEICPICKVPRFKIHEIGRE
ncbi:MAG: rubredoxin [Clostridia bacterium]